MSDTCQLPQEKMRTSACFLRPTRRAHACSPPPTDPNPLSPHFVGQSETDFTGAGGTIYHPAPCVPHGRAQLARCLMRAPPTLLLGSPIRQGLRPRRLCAPTPPPLRPLCGANPRPSPRRGRPRFVGGVSRGQPSPSGLECPRFPASAPLRGSPPGFRGGNRRPPG